MLSIISKSSCRRALLSSIAPTGANQLRVSLSTKASSSSEKPLKYFSAWFCPFAHRATLALEHHAVPYEWEEALGWETRQPTGDENFSAEDRSSWEYHWKSPALLAANPLGMVPTLLDANSGRSVTESLVCIEFIDEVAQLRGSSAPSLLPGDPFDRARARVAADDVNKTVCSAYYQVLVRTDAEERRQGFEKLQKGLLEFARDAAREDRAFWGGDSPGLVDFVLLPYAYRFYVLEHYRGSGFAIPSGKRSEISADGGKDGEIWAWYHNWLRRCTALPSVACTLPDKARYLEHVKKYAEGRARSKVGNAVRRGVSAHAYEDNVDG